jgi:hypothetical protein
VIVSSSSLQNFVVAHGLDPDGLCVWVALLVQDCLLGFCVDNDPNLNLEHVNFGIGWLLRSRLWSVLSKKNLTWLSRRVI